MKLQNIDVQETINRVKILLKEDSHISTTLRSAIEVMLMLVTILLGRISLNSKNSSKPPSEDKNRTKKSREKSGKKNGAQPGHVAARLEKIADPDEIQHLKIDKRRLPKGNYQTVGFETRQVFDFKISRYVIEYRAEILEDETGKRYVAEFPKDVKNDVQYGTGIKAHAVYLSQEQLIPYQRVQDYFESQIKIPLSVGSIFNFNLDAFNQLERFEAIAKEKLIESSLLHGDETGINVNGKRIWLHNASNERWTYFFPHEKRGSEATDTIGILPKFQGTLIHDHWKPYYTYGCTHALCNGHHLRELEYAEKEEKQKWAKRIKKLLLLIKK